MHGHGGDDKTYKLHLLVDQRSETLGIVSSRTPCQLRAISLKSRTIHFRIRTAYNHCQWPMKFNLFHFSGKEITYLLIFHNVINRLVILLVKVRGQTSTNHLWKILVLRLLTENNHAMLDYIHPGNSGQ